MKSRATYVALWLCLQPAYGLDLTFSGPITQTHSSNEEFVSYKLPIGPYQDGRIQTLIAEGAQRLRAWQIDSATGTTLGIADNLRQQIEAVGFEILYECETQECGGFDFRFDTKVLPEPDMHVDLGNYRYIAAQRLGEAVPEYLSLLISRSAALGYVQMIRVGGVEDVNTSVDTTATRPGPSAERSTSSRVLAPLISRMETQGSAVLQDLAFATGSATLPESRYDTLDTLADYLIANPDRQVALVGHTDAVGALDGNIALSRKRAQSAARRLIELGVSQGQVEADGVGYLSPVASNLTEEGRRQNRRVEVILTSTR